MQFTNGKKERVKHAKTESILTLVASILRVESILCPKNWKMFPTLSPCFFDDQTTSFSLTRFSYFTKYLEMRKIFSKNVFDEIYLVFMTELAIN